jgi:hypothetical protein
MANNYNKNKKNYNRPPNEQLAESNSQKTQPSNNSYEYNSYNNKLTYNTYYTFDLFDYYTPEQIMKLVKDPMGNNKLLREISNVLYGTNGVFRNTVDYMVAMPTLDRVIVTYGKNKGKKDTNKQLVDSTLRTIKDKEIVRDALFRGMVEGVAFYYFETTTRPQTLKKNLTDYEVDSIAEINDYGVNAAVISLPADWTKIVGTKNSSYIIAFNLDYFDMGDNEPTESKLRKFPKEIREAYRDRKQNKTKGNWYVLDNSKTIVHKISSKHEEPWGRPIVLAAIKDILYNDYFTQTKRNVLDEINNRIIYQTFPEGKEKGTSALNKTQQKNQHEAVKGAVMNKNNRGGISFFSVAAGTKISSIEAKNTDIFDDKFESKLDDKIAMAMGIAASLLNGVGSGSYAAQQLNLELITGQIFQWVDQIQEELNKCIINNIIQDYKNRAECRYLHITHVNKAEMVTNAKDLYLQGKGSLALWSASVGVPPEVFFALLDEELENDVENKYPPHKTSFTMSGNDSDDKGGRPETDNPTDKTMNGRANNGNGLPSPSDKK